MVTRHPLTHEAANKGTKGEPRAVRGKAPHRRRGPPWACTHAAQASQAAVRGRDVTIDAAATAQPRRCPGRHTPLATI